MLRKAVFGMCIAACTAFLPQQSWAQTKDAYPSRIIKLVIPYAPGGLSDGVVRAVADELQRTHHMQLMVENRTGGNTVIAATAVAKAQPDGYTLGWFSASTFTTLPALTPNLQFKNSDFQPVFMAYQGPIVFAVANNLPVSNPAEFVAYMKKQGQPALVGATAKGGAGHLTSAALGHEARLDTELVVYRGGPPMVMELMAGGLPAGMDILDTFLQQHRAHKLKIIGHTGKSRLAVLPEVQTFAEAGFPNVKGQFWHGLFAPRGTPPEIVKMLNERFNAAMKSPAVAARLSPDLQVNAISPAEFEAHIARDKAYWESIIKETNIKIDQ